MRNALIIIITVLLISLVIVEQVFVDSTFNTLETQTLALNDKISASTDINTTDIKNSSNSLMEYWSNIEEILCLTMNHKDLDKIGEEINKVKTYVNENNKEYALYELNVLLFYIDSYQKITAVSFKNVI